MGKREDSLLTTSLKYSQFPQTGVCHSLRENEIVEHAKMKHCEVTLDCQA